MRKHEEKKFSVGMDLEMLKGNRRGPSGSQMTV